jgi:polysaccharide transporter, PST family
VERDELTPESGARRYAANAAWLLLAQVAAKGASFVFVVVVARSLGARDFGLFSFALAFVPLFLVFGRLGLETTVVREIARDRNRLSELFASGLALRVSLGLVGLAIALATGPLFLDGGRAWAVLAVVGAALLLDELSGFVGTVFRAFERMRYHALVVVVNRFLSTGLALAVVVLDGDLLAICLVYLAGSAGALAYAYGAFRRNFPPIDWKRGRRSVVRALVTTGLPIGVAGILNTALFRVDTVLLQAIRGPVEVGLYNVAYRFFESLLFVAWALGNLTLPRVSRHGAGRAAARDLETAVALSLSFYLPLAVTLPFAAEWLVTAVFSEQYASAADTVAVLTAASALYSVAFAARIGAIALGKTVSIAGVAAVALVVNVAANAWAIPRYGFEGAAWSTLGAEVVEAALLAALFVRANGTAPRLRPVVPPVLASVCVLVALLGTGAEGPSALGLGAAVYLPALATAAFVLARDEVRRLPSILRPRRAT